MAAWQEPDFEPVSPDVAASNPVRHTFRTHEAPWQSEEFNPPHKKIKLADTNHGFADPNHGFMDPNHGFTDTNHGFTDPNHGFTDPNRGFQPSSIAGGAAGSMAPPVTWANRAPGANNLLQKTKLCARYVAGTCTYNANCNFAHGVEELRKPPLQLQRVSNQGPVVRPHKTRPCKFFREGNCPYGERCTFFHGQEGQPQGQVRPAGYTGGGAVRAGNWKTKLCVNWEGGQQCNFGAKCNFAHGLAELQKHGGGSFRAESGIGVQGGITPKDKFCAPYSDSSRFGYISTSSYCPEENIQNCGFQSSETNIPTMASYFVDNMHQEAKTLPYQNPQDNANSQYNGYTSPTNEWEKFNVAVPSEPNNSQMYGQATQPNNSQMYGQATQQQPWVSYSETNNLNSRREDEPGSSDYFQNQQHQENIVPFFRGSTRHEYQPEMTSGFRQYANSDSFPSRHGNVNLHTGHDYAEGSGYADQDNGPYY